ncbi:hypothetical protein [Caviibacterium pharyngocola]|uniref:Uncharacterized protein n=1 Tax=Caviibacterium pharyngocola TaxID=28159 RepID=A0A2M8RSZ2_9PAST|nr:hypothetical protein [Caviibacterium pharyngocola]PJG82007.1 hypothetical protein CVP04_11555 [Caviibacterium pharyngocola]
MSLEQQENIYQQTKAKFNELMPLFEKMFAQYNKLDNQAAEINNEQKRQLDQKINELNKNQEKELEKYKNTNSLRNKLSNRLENSNFFNLLAYTQIIALVLFFINPNIQETLFYSLNIEGEFISILSDIINFFVIFLVLSILYYKTGFIMNKKIAILVSVAIFLFHLNNITNGHIAEIIAQYPSFILQGFILPSIVIPILLIFSLLMLKDRKKLKTLEEQSKKIDQIKLKYKNLAAQETQNYNAEHKALREKMLLTDFYAEAEKNPEFKPLFDYIPKEFLSLNIKNWTPIYAIKLIERTDFYQLNQIIQSKRAYSLTEAIRALDEQKHREKLEEKAEEAERASQYAKIQASEALRRADLAEQQARQAEWKARQAEIRARDAEYEASKKYY